MRIYTIKDSTVTIDLKAFLAAYPSTYKADPFSGTYVYSLVIFLAGAPEIVRATFKSPEELNAANAELLKVWAEYFNLPYNERQN
jgi:hypothetical protein